MLDSTALRLYVRQFQFSRRFVLATLVATLIFGVLLGNIITAFVLAILAFLLGITASGGWYWMAEGENDTLAALAIVTAPFFPIASVIAMYAAQGLLPETHLADLFIVPQIILFIRGSWAGPKIADAIRWRRK